MSPLVRYYSEGEHGYAQGWYFEDESNNDRDNGPYLTEAECFAALQGYLHWLEFGVQ